MNRGEPVGYVAPFVITQLRSSSTQACIYRDASNDMVPLYTAPPPAVPQPSQAGESQDAARYRWLWNNAHNVSFTYQVNPMTKATVVGLHCGSLTDTIDAAINAKGAPA